MKKSKVLIPAMALLLFSTAASITGTVAWFTSTRIFNLEAGNFHVAQLDGNLDCTVTAGVGTFKNAAGNIVVGTDANDDKVKDDNVEHRLVDASFDTPAGATSGHAYRINRDNDGYDDYHAIPASAPGDWKIKDITDSGVTTNYFVAVTWTLQFEYKFNNETNPVAVYLDLRGTESYFKDVTYDNAANPAGLDSAKGMRIALLSESGKGVNKVWGNHIPLQSSEYEEYSNSGTYSEGSKVHYQGKIYAAASGFTHDADFATELANHKWSETYDVTLGDQKAYAAGEYEADALVVNNGDVYKATEAFTSSDFATELTAGKWVKVTTADLRYVQGPANAPSSNVYTKDTYIYNQSLQRADDNAADYASRPDYICTIQRDVDESGDEPVTLNSGTTTVTCVAWFEGEDPNIVNGTAMASLGANLKFYSRSITIA